ncbi:Uncharacterised protein [Salmonella sp. NCTC 11881]|nr:Uncharacterised protein [Salmonella sp. NCTC 11881]
MVKDILAPGLRVVFLRHQSGTLLGEYRLSVCASRESFFGKLFIWPVSPIDS